MCALSHTRVVDVSAGALHSLAVSEQGELFSWGAGRSGKLGHGDEEMRPLPTAVRALEGRRIVRACAGDSHSLVLGANGTLYSFGLGEGGRLGHGSEERLLTPAPVTALLRAGAVCGMGVGSYHSIVLVRPWPGGASAQKRAAGNDATETARSNYLTSEAPEAKRAAVLSSHAAVDAMEPPDGAEPAGDADASEATLVYTFGDGAYGKLGHGDTADQLYPRLVRSLGEGVAEVAAGYQHSAVRTRRGGVLTAGIGWKGQLGTADLGAGREALGMAPDFYHAREFQPVGAEPSCSSRCAR